MLPRTKIDDTARSTEVALLILLVSEILRRRGLIDSAMGLIWSSSSSVMLVLGRF